MTLTETDRRHPITVPPDPFAALFVPDADRGRASDEAADEEQLPSADELSRWYSAAAGQLRTLDPTASIIPVRFTPGLGGEALRRWKRDALVVIADIEERVSDLRAAGRDPWAASRRDAIERRYQEVRNRVRAMTVSQHGARDPIFRHAAAALLTWITSLGLVVPDRWTSLEEADARSEARVQRFEREAQALYARMRAGAPPPPLPPGAVDDEDVVPTLGIPWNAEWWRTEMVWHLHGLAARGRTLVAAWRDDDPVLAGKAAELLDELGLVWIGEGLSLEEADNANAMRLEDWERLLARLEQKPIPPPLPPGLAWRRAFDGSWELESDNSTTPPSTSCCRRRRETRGIEPVVTGRDVFDGANA